MGNSASEIADNAPACGYRVLGVHPHGPGAHAVLFPDADAARDGVREPVHMPLVAHFDVIVSVNGIPLEAEGDALAREVRANANSAPVILEVYNTKCGRYGTFQLRPSDGWGGDGLLGLDVRWDVLHHDVDALSLHVTEVEEGSPAAACGFLPNDDWLLGAAEREFDGDGSFGEYVAEHAAAPMTLFVYRASCDAVWSTRLEVAPEALEAGVGVALATGRMHALPNRSTRGRNAFEVGTEEASAHGAGEQTTTPQPLEHRVTPLAVHPASMFAAPGTAEAAWPVSPDAAAAQSGGGPQPALFASAVGASKDGGAHFAEAVME